MARMMDGWNDGLIDNMMGMDVMMDGLVDRMMDGWIE